VDEDFWDKHISFIGMTHSLHVSTSNSAPIVSIRVEVAALKRYLTYALKCVVQKTAVSGTQDTHKIAAAISKACDSKLSHLIKRLALLDPPPPRIVVVAKRKRETLSDTDSNEDETGATAAAGSRSGCGEDDDDDCCDDRKKSDKKKARMDNNVPMTRPTKSSKRIRPEKQTRDTTRRVVVDWYLRTYMNIKLDLPQGQTPPHTYEKVEELIKTKHELFETHMEERDSMFVEEGFTKRDGKKWHEMPGVVDLYTLCMIRSDADEHDYDDSVFADFPPSLMKKLRIRIVKSEKSKRASPRPVTTEESDSVLRARATSTRIFEHLKTRVSGSTSTSAKRSPSVSDDDIAQTQPIDSESDE
jgi:hypothetical protein